MKAIIKEKDEYMTGEEYAIVPCLYTWPSVAEEELKSLQQEKEENLQMIASMSSYTIHAWFVECEQLLKKNCYYTRNCQRID